MPASLSRGSRRMIAGEITVADRTDNSSEVRISDDDMEFPNIISYPRRGGRTRSFPSPRPAHAAGPAALVSADDESTGPTGWARAASLAPTSSNIDSTHSHVKDDNEHIFDERRIRGAVP
ncbi:hypothetical protein Pth03_22590 [Planotetraspora thailandica]|uniref:Uncharacterized protein n=1 Tax=Planotetraspora thailandica TaxID=487172 RepID=A0A8J3XVB8_9ACTN|nr:hypothetical protein Pth03_22590 [Planotetraspora thailandica]